MIVPEVLGVIVAAQLDTVEFTLARVHGVPVKLPEDVPVFVNATVPPGAEAVPAAVSVTNAVHVTVVPTGTEEGEHDAKEDVLRRLTVTVFPVPLLPQWAVSATATV